MRYIAARTGIMVASCALFCVASLGDDVNARSEKYMKLALAEAEKIPDDATKAYFFLTRRIYQRLSKDDEGAAETYRLLGELAARSNDEKVKSLYDGLASDDRAGHGDVDGVLQRLQNEDPNRRADRLYSLGKNRQEAEDYATAKPLLAHAARAADGITKRSNDQEDTDHASKYQVLFFIASTQAKAHDEEGALNTIKMLPLDGRYGSLFHYDACCWVAIRFAKNGNEQGALRLIEESAQSLDTIDDIPSPKGDQVRKKATTVDAALPKLAEAQATAKRLTEAIKTTEKIQSPERRAQALGEVARVRLEANDPEESAQAIQAMDVSHAKVDALLALAKAHLEGKANDKAKATVKEALEVARALPGAEKSRVLRETAEAQARLGDFTSAAETAGAIVAPAERAHAWRKLAKFQQAAGDAAGASKSIEHALADAQDVPGNSWKADFYCLAGDVLASLSERKPAAEAYKKSIQAALAMTDIRPRPSIEQLAGATLASQFRNGDLADANETLKRLLQRAQKLPPRPNSPFPGYERAASVGGIASVLTLERADDKNLKWIGELSTPAERAWAYLGAARGLEAPHWRKDD